MPNLVGIGLSQVPTNSMLGGMAYQDPEHTSIKDLDLRNLSQINSEIADTAVDIFIYDTSKDSDGGAWRKRTRDKSWYNEALGTHDRGTRKDFPAVAVIVATSDDVIIYDGDDPNFPMWMIFESSDTGTPYQTHYLGRGSGFSGFQTNIKSIGMVNGVLVVAKTGTAGNYAEAYTEINFIKDNAFHIDDSSAADMGNEISTRNGGAGGRYTNSTYGTLGHYNLNDIAIRVLPNAPIDKDTGLPRPTIAIAHPSGVSIIRHNRTVCEISAFSPVNFVDLSDEFVYATAVPGNGVNYMYKTPIPRKSVNYNAAIIDGSDGYYMNSVNGSTDPEMRLMGIDSMDVGPDGDFYRAGNAGFDKVTSTGGGAITDVVSKNMVAHIASDYNSGYMVGAGNAQGSYLSSITTASGQTALTPNDLLGGKGTFDDASYWSIASNWSVSGGVATSNGSNGYLSKSGIFTAGQQYSITLTISNYSSGTLYVYAGSGAPGNGNHYLGISGNSVGNTNVHTMILNAHSSSLGLYSSGFNGTIDNVKVSSTFVDDRGSRRYGVQGYPLGIYGSLFKEPVAPGAELAAYYGFTGTNYLVHNSTVNRNFGTSNICLISWFKVSTINNYQYLMSVFDGTSNQVCGLAMMVTTGRLYVFDTNTVHESSVGFGDGLWHCAVGIIHGNSRIAYVDGKKVIDSTNTNNPALTNADRFAVGHYCYQKGVQYPFLGKLALTRFSTTIPSEKQIKKIYEDEKHLFQENAKATLYGDSDTVTALTVDHTTNTLHAGTSAGRSEFQGLRRINNTTTAVTTVISASNGLVAEQ